MLSMLLIYPGALVDSLLRKFVFNKFTDKNIPETRRLARYFVFSTMISTFSLFLFSLFITGAMGSLAETISLIKTDWNILLYLVITLVSTLLFTAIYWHGRKPINRLFNQYLLVNKGITLDDTHNLWASIIEDKDIDNANLIACIKKEGEIVTVGWLKTLPSDIEQEPALILSWTKHFIDIFNEEDANKALKIIGSPKVEYLHLASGFVIMLYDGTKYYETVTRKASADQSALDPS